MIRGTKKNNYRFQERHFLRFCDGKEITIPVLKDYRKKLLDENFKSSTKRVHWAAAFNFVIENSKIMSKEIIIKEFAWINWSMPFVKSVKNTIYILTESEFQKLISSNIVSERIKLLMMAIAYSGKRISEIIKIKSNENFLTPDFREKCFKVFKCNKFLFGTG